MSKKTKKRSSKKKHGGARKNSGFPKGRYRGISKKKCARCKVKHRLRARDGKPHCPKANKSKKRGKQ